MWKFTNGFIAPHIKHVQCIVVGDLHIVALLEDTDRVFGLTVDKLSTT